MTEILSFQEYLKDLDTIVDVADLVGDSPEAPQLRELAYDLLLLDPLSVNVLGSWISGNAVAVRVLGLTVGLSQERLKNICKHRFDTSSFARVAKEYSLELVEYLEDQYSLLMSLQMQRSREYTFGDILVARAGTRSTASRAGHAGRTLEDKLEAVVKELGLEYRTRGRFEGRGMETAPFDIAIVNAFGDVQIAVAAKGFDSTGSKLSDAVREIEQMANVRLPSQYVFAAVDGIGWKSRTNDLRRIHDMWATHRIDGMFTSKSLPEFRIAIDLAAKRLGLLY